MKSKYFNAGELACRCGCGMPPGPEIVAVADQLREMWGGPLFVSSGARCYEHTIALRARGIPAALRSAHREGLALDLRPEKPEQIIDFQRFVESKLDQLDIYMEDRRFTRQWAHIQTRPTKSGNRIFHPGGNVYDS